MDFYEIMLQQKLAGGGGGGDIEVDSLSVTENGTYTASSGHAYSPVTVNVPNTYAAGDEGKVVSNGALVGQTSVTKTANGTYDTTLNDEVVVNVPSVTPTGNINITSTAQTDVSAYATAQVVDADLVAGNIKKDVDILGVIGTYEGGGGGSGDIDKMVDGTIESYTGNVTALRTRCFQGCTNLRSVTLPNVVTVGDSAFSGLANLLSVEFGASLQSLGSYAFYNTNKWDSLTFRSTTPPTLGSTALNGYKSGAKIYVPAEAVSTYKAASGWSSYASIIEAIPE